MDERADAPRRLVAGECIVDLHADEAGGVGAAGAYRRRAGGAPANVAVGLARLGEPPALWTRLGTDGFGDFLAGVLADEGVDDAFVTRDDDAPTGLAVVGRDDAGDRSFSLYLDGTASVRLDAGTVDDGALARAGWIHAGGVELAHQPGRSAVLDAMERAPEGTTVSFDPNARPRLWRSFDYGETLAAALPLVDVVVASPEDLRPAGYEGDAPALARALTAEGPHTAVVTRGDAGAYGYATDAAPWGPAEADHAGFDPDVVDTTGAGDAFTAGLIAALDRRGGGDAAAASRGGGDATAAADDGRLAAALRFANAVAAASTTAEGAMTALPTRAAVEGVLGAGGSGSPADEE